MPRLVRGIHVFLDYPDKPGNDELLLGHTLAVMPVLDTGIHEHPSPRIPANSFGQHMVNTGARTRIPEAPDNRFRSIAR